MKDIQEEIIDGEYIADTEITVDEWIEILQNDKILQPYYKDVLLKIYKEPGHKSTCKNLSIKYGQHPQSYNAPITHFGKAVKKALNRFRVIGMDGKETYWSIVMTGKGTGMNFEWTIKPELVEAIQKSGILSFDPMIEMLNRYKEHLKKSGLKDELYKWELIKKFQGKPDVLANNFANEIKSLDISNLAYRMTKAVTNTIVDKEPETYKAAFVKLFNEENSLNDRVKTFIEDIKQLYKSMGETLSPHHNEREIATFLTYHNPEKYTFYMPKFYEPYCNFLGIKHKATGEKYNHYMNLVDDLIEKYISKDAELLTLVDNVLLTGDYYPDKNRKILAQDFLYQMFDPKRNKQEVIEEIIESNTKDIMQTQPLNQILYGPPGTGKTYNTINKAINIINPEFDTEESRRKTKQEFNRLVEAGQIVFTTFHQSMTYEDFVEGIKPIMSDEEKNILEYQIEDGIFKKMAYIAKYSIINEGNQNKTEISREELFENIYNQLISDVEEKLANNQDYEIPSRTGLKLYIYRVSDQLNLHIKHENSERILPHVVSKKRIQKLFLHFSNPDEIKNINNEIRNVIGGSNATTYWGVLSELTERANKFKKNTTEQLASNNEINYERIKSIIANTSLSKVEVKSKMTKTFVLIIDEINRGNISQIFGELITLIEEDKRLGNSETLEVTLPYSKEKFGVPSNLYIIGTMNTADRSVEALDTALRRRFIFEEMTSKPEIIPQVGKAENGIVEDINLEKLLITLNKRIELLLNRDHQIGHSYFLQVSNLKMLKETFHNKIIPLLQEYFFGDFGKIGLTLGSGFVELSNEHSNNDKFFANFHGDYSYADYLERPVYKILNPVQMTDEEFIHAIGVLMNE